MLFKNLFGDVIEIVKEEEPGDFYRVIRFLNSFEEAEHPRDEAGRFTDKGAGSDTATGTSTPSSEKQIEIKGDELGKYKDIKELRQKAVDYYRKNLSGTYVNHNKIGKIIFTLSGYKKPISFSADKRKLLLFPYLPYPCCPKLRYRTLSPLQFQL